jgi:hypothetical protein
MLFDIAGFICVNFTVTVQSFLLLSCISLWCKCNQVVRLESLHCRLTDITVYLFSTICGFLIVQSTENIQYRGRVEIGGVYTTTLHLMVDIVERGRACTPTLASLGWFFHHDGLYAWKWLLPILGQNSDKRLKSFPPCYSQSPLQLCLEISVSLTKL